MRPQLPVPHVEGLVVNQEPQQLAVGHVDHGLARLRIPAPCLGVGERAQLVDAVEVGAGKTIGFPFIEVAPKAMWPLDRANTDSL